MPCIDGFSILLQRYVRKGYDAKNPAIFRFCFILVPRGRAPFGQHQESRPLAKSNTGSPRFTDFPSLCASSESSLTNLIGSGLNLLCLQSHSKAECRWTRPEVAILGADQKERGLWGREWFCLLPKDQVKCNACAVARKIETDRLAETFRFLMIQSLKFQEIWQKID